VVRKCGEVKDRHTVRQIRTRVTNIHFASPTPHAKCNALLVWGRYSPLSCSLSWVYYLFECTDNPRIILHCFNLRQSKRRFVLFGVRCVDVMAMSACRYFRVTTGGAGTGRWTRTTLLHRQSPRHHSGDHDERYRQTSDIQRQKQTSSSYCCRFQEQVNDVVVTVRTFTTLYRRRLCSVLAMLNKLLQTNRVVKPSEDTFLKSNGYGQSVTADWAWLSRV